MDCVGSGPAAGSGEHSTAPPVTGIRALTVVPVPGALSISSLPPSALTRSVSPPSPVPAEASAPPTPSSRTSKVAAPSTTRTSTRTWLARACFAVLVSASATTK